MYAVPRLTSRVGFNSIELDVAGAVGLSLMSISICCAAFKADGIDAGGRRGKVWGGVLTSAMDAVENVLCLVLVTEAVIELKRDAAQCHQGRTVG